METEIASGRGALLRGAEIIKSGGVVAFPTETVYGLGADAYNADAVAEIYRAKGRPSDNPLIVHIADTEQAEGLVTEFSDAARAVAKAFMPGPVTLILPKSPAVPNAVSAGLPTVGIRMPSHEVAREFIRECGVPIAAPSANVSAHISPTSAAHVYEDLKGRIPLIIDGGECGVGIESTIIDLSSDVPTILRPGAVTEEMLTEVLGEVTTFRGEVKVAKAPGMKYKHYAPKCDTVVADGPDAAAAEYAARRAEGKRYLILARESDCKALGREGVLSLGKTDEEVCRNVYGALRYAEKHADGIIFVDLGDGGICGSVMNRVNKSAGGCRVGLPK